MKYFCALVLLACGNQVYAAAMKEKSLQQGALALAGFVKSAVKTPKFKTLWKKQLQSKKTYYVEPLYPSKAVAAIAVDDGTISVLDKKTGKCLSLLASSDPQQKIIYAKSIPGNRLVLARDNGLLEVVTINPKGDSTTIELPSGLDDVRGVAFGRVQGEPRLVVAGYNRGGRIAEFNIDTWKREETRLNYCPDCVTTTQDGPIQFTEYYDSIFRRNIATYNGKDDLDWMHDLPRAGTPSSLGPLYLSPYGMIGSNFAAYEMESLDGWSEEERRWISGPKTVIRLYRKENMMPLGIETSTGGVERFVAEGPGTLVTALDKQLHVRNEDGTIMQTLLKGDDITGFAYERGKMQDHIFAAAHTLHYNNTVTEISAWAAEHEETKEDEDA